MRALDAKGKDLMHLYLTMTTPVWTACSAACCSSLYYWSANQFVIARLAARSDRGQLGIVTAGFSSCLSFMSIGTGVATFIISRPPCRVSRSTVILPFHS